MDLSNCICYVKRKKDKKDKAISLKDYQDKMKVISSPKLSPQGDLIKIYCSNVLCNVYDNSPLKKQAVYHGNVYNFCSDECWENWLENPSIYSNLTPPIRFKDVPVSISELKI